MTQIPSRLNNVELSSRRLLRLPPVLWIVLVWSVKGVVAVAVVTLSNAGVLSKTQIAMTSLSGVLLSLSLYGVTRRLMEESSRYALSIIAATAVMGGSALWIINVLLRFWLGDDRGEAKGIFLRWPSESFFVGLRYNWMYFTDLFALQAVIFALLSFANSLKKQERKLLETHLAALRFQLNPHFLFNTLNTIAMVAEEDVAKAQEMITRLSDFLRTSLSEKPTGLVSLAGEMDIIQAYLGIESIRFGDRLSIHYACSAGLADAQVPSLILQPLVENAIKYAVAPSKELVNLSIEASAADNDLILVVEDDGKHGPVADDEHGIGVGLRNVAARLEALYGPAGRIEVIKREQGFTAVIRLPLQRMVE